MWKTIGGMFRRRELTEDESRELALDVCVVMNKYAARSMQWAPEMALGFTLWGLWNETAPPPPPAVELEDPAGTKELTA